MTAPKHTVWVLRCQGLGLVLDRVFVDKGSDEAVAFERRKARDDADLYGVSPKTGKRRQLFTRWEKLVLVGDPAQLEPHKEAPPEPPPPASTGLPGVVVSGQGEVTPAGPPPPLPAAIPPETPPAPPEPPPAVVEAEDSELPSDEGGIDNPSSEGI